MGISKYYVRFRIHEHQGLKHLLKAGWYINNRALDLS